MLQRHESDGSTQRSALAGSEPDSKDQLRGSTGPMSDSIQEISASSSGDSDSDSTGGVSSSSSSSSSSSRSQVSEDTLIETLGVKTLICDNSEMVRPREEDGEEKEEKKEEEGRPYERNGRSRTNNNNPPISSSSSSSVSSSTASSSSTYKRYKFGLTNHFLTMPDVDEREQAKVYQKSAELLDQTKLKPSYHRAYRAMENNSSKVEQQRRRHAQRKQWAQVSSRDRKDTRRLRHQRDDSDCDLSVLPPSSPDANSLLSRESHWSPLEQQTANNMEESQLVSEGDGKTSAHHDRVTSNRMTLTQDLAQEARLMPAGDAGLDAGRCNSKASHNLTSANHHHHQKHKPADCYLDPDTYHIQTSNSPNQHHANLSDGQHEHEVRNKSGLSGHVSAATAAAADNDHDCASNGLLVRMSSIMYATFLVILGCILHVSELRQKSRNSSDHIYTTIVALLGIFWLLFLQADLQRYKRYASKFILLESIFNDHQHYHQQQQQQQLQYEQQLKTTGSQSGGPLSTGGGGLLGLDPSARSTTSSSASLVNDRMSMNTEVIFKKTAYKMYQQHSPAIPQPLGPLPPSTIANYKLAVGNPLKYNHHHHHLRDIESTTSPDTTAETTSMPRLVPAYMFLHGKMGANFYLKCGMAAFCFGHVIHEGLRFGQQMYFFATNNGPCRDSAALIAHLVTPLYSFYQLFMMFKYSNLVINRHKVLARFGLMHIIGTCVTFWFRTILEEAFEDFVHKMDYFKAQNKPIIHYLDPTTSPIARSPLSDEAAQPTNAGLAHWLGSLASLAVAGEPGASGTQHVPLISAASGGSPRQQQQNLTLLAQSTLLALMSSPLSATITPQIVRHLPDSYHCAQNTLLTTKSMNALPYLYPFTIEYNLLIAAIFLSLYFNIGKLRSGYGAGKSTNNLERNAHNARCTTVAPSIVGGGFNAPPSPYYNHRPHTVASKQPIGSSQLSSGSSFIGSQLDLMTNNSTTSECPTNASYAPGLTHRFSEKFSGEYKSNFVVNADCHAANKGLFLGFFVLLVTLVTIVIFFVTINKPSHLQLGIKINLIQEATLTSLILIVTLAGYRQITRLNQNPLIKNTITTDDVLMLIPLPFFFIHSLLSIRAETATLYTPHHLTMSKTGSGSGLTPLETAASLLGTSEMPGGNGHRTNGTTGNLGLGAKSQQRVSPSPDFMLGLPSGLAIRSNLTSSSSSHMNLTAQKQQEHTSNRSEQQQQQHRMDQYKLMTIVLNLAVMIEVLVQTNFIIDGLRRCSESRYLRFKKPGRELITFAIILNITYWIVATFETKSVEQYKTEIDYYGPLPYMFISHTTLPVMLFYRYHSSVCLAEIWNRAYKPPKRGLSMRI